LKEENKKINIKLELSKGEEAIEAAEVLFELIWYLEPRISRITRIFLGFEPRISRITCPAFTRDWDLNHESFDRLRTCFTNYTNFF